MDKNVQKGAQGLIFYEHCDIQPFTFTTDYGKENKLVLYLAHSKKCWVKYNPVLGKYWTEHKLGCFQPTVGLNV